MISQRLCESSVDAGRERRDERVHAGSGQSTRLRRSHCHVIEWRICDDFADFLHRLVARLDNGFDYVDVKPLSAEFFDLGSEFRPGLVYG